MHLAQRASLAPCGDRVVRDDTGNGDRVDVHDTSAVAVFNSDSRAVGDRGWTGDRHGRAITACDAKACDADLPVLGFYFRMGAGE